MKPLVVLSLFDGMSCGLEALKRAGIPVKKYYASEIDKHAIKIAMKNHPEIIQLGDIEMWDFWNIQEEIDLLIGGSPCQGFSFAGKGLNFEDPRSKLFFTYHKIKEFYKPKKFLLENVKMKKEYLNIITEYMGLEPMFINSNLVSAQNRKRYYWFNWKVNHPEDRNILLKDILIDAPSCPIGIAVREKARSLRVGGLTSPIGSKQNWNAPFIIIGKNGKPKSQNFKAGCLTGGANSGGNHSDMDIIHGEFATRRYTPVECERLQTLPDNYTEGVSNSQRYKMLGNGWTVEVIVHLFKGILV